MAGTTARAGVLISATAIVEHDTQWLTSNGYPEATNGVSVLKLTYRTSAVDGSQTIATAAFVDPITSCATPLVCYIHGTIFLKDQVPSSWQDGTGSCKEGYSFGGTGMACVLPDLLGLGGSPGLHPYLHAASEATACIDAVRAAREYRTDQARPLHEQLFIMGASAGSHACLATAQAMQTQYPEEFHVSAAGGISGPYAPYPVLKDQILSTATFGAGASVLYVLFSYDSAYPGLFSSTNDFLVEPFATEIPPLYDGQHDGDVINPLLPPVIGAVIPQTLRNSIANNPNAPLNLALKENNVFNWKPLFPVKLCYCGNDEIVSPINTTIAKNAFDANGSDQVSTVEVSGSASHTDCGDLARPVIVDWFRSLKVACDGTYPLPVTGKAAFTIAPDPVTDGTTTLDLGSLPDSGKGVHIIITNSAGTIVFTGASGPNDPSLFTVYTSTWAAGTYLVTVQLSGAAYYGKFVVLK
ncbi:MAG: T9SS type A sorting domain-containing protein [Flavobacteriales bacterium]|nr:T9SS type A sorting domain-containing protein [Flavobacteriales bacterium]